MEVLLAAPGTGKTTKIKSIIESRFNDASSILVLSFTNATINDLRDSFKSFRNVKCITLHSYALTVNHLPQNHVLHDIETFHLMRFSKKMNMDFMELCEQLKCMTFEMMISSSINFINGNPAYAQEKIGNIDLLVVDEFQDFNEVERNLIFLLQEFAKNVIILGDDDQSIYDFKNADPEALIGIYNSKSNVKIGHEHICYRCPDEVVDYCTILIKHNSFRVDKVWRKSNRNGELKVLQAWSQASVNRYIIERINEIHKNKPKESILILSSVKIASQPVVNALEQSGIEHVNFLKESIDKQEFYLIWWLRAIFGNHKLLNIILIICYHKLLAKIKLVETFKEYFKDRSKLNELITLALTYDPLKIPISVYLQAIPTLDEFMRLNTEFVRFTEFINKDEIEKSVDEIVKNYNKAVAFDPSKVNIMTIHKSKGLQADNVFILGLTEGLLPDKSEGTDNLEAQRRILYVGMTRAIKRLLLISCSQWETKDILGTKADKSQFKFNSRKTMVGKTSSFVYEMGLTVYKI